MTTFLPDMLDVRHGGEDGKRVLIDLHVPAELPHFAGHFPGLPILPGVVLIDWAVQYARAFYALSDNFGGNFGALENIKFLAPVQPDTRLTLALDWLPEKSRLEFAYYTHQRKYSSGRIVFGGAA